MALTTAHQPAVLREPGPPAPPPHAAGTRRGRAGARGWPGTSSSRRGCSACMGITAIPMLLSLYLSFTNYDVLIAAGPRSSGSGWTTTGGCSPPTRRYWHAVTVTLTFALIAVPLKLAAALGVALLLNRERRGVGLFRGLFYLPSLLGGSVALAIVWVGHVQPRRARSTRFLALFGIEGKPWVNDPDWALETLMVLAIWQFGAPMVIFLAGLKQVPDRAVRGGRRSTAPARWRQFWQRHAADALAGHLLQPGAGDHQRLPGLHRRRSCSATAPAARSTPP